MTQAVVLSYWTTRANPTHGTVNVAAVAASYTLTSYRDQPENDTAQSPKLTAKAFVCLIDVDAATQAQMISDYTTQLAACAFFPLWWPGQSLDGTLTASQKTQFANWLVARGVASGTANAFIASNPTRRQIGRAVAQASGQG